MIEDALRLLRAHQRTGALLDSNLLFLFVLGALDRRQIALAKRAREFTERDFDLLVALMDRVDRLIVTAYIAAEVSNLATSLNAFHRARFLQLLRALLTNRGLERHVPLRLVVEIEDVEVVGVTDAAILRVRSRPPLVITTDWPLAKKLEAASRPVINFNHLRGAAVGIYSP